MDINEIKRKIESYCIDCGSCERCGLSNDDAPNLSNCFTHATDDEVRTNYEYLLSRGYI